MVVNYRNASFTIITQQSAQKYRPNHSFSYILSAEMLSTVSTYNIDDHARLHISGRALISHEQALICIQSPVSIMLHIYVASCYHEKRTHDENGWLVATLLLDELNQSVSQTIHCSQVFHYCGPKSCA